MLSPVLGICRQVIEYSLPHSGARAVSVEQLSIPNSHVRRLPVILADRLQDKLRFGSAALPNL
jgi:hypothetical protein